MHSFIKCTGYFSFQVGDTEGTGMMKVYNLADEVDIKQVQVTPIVLVYSCPRALS